MRNIPGPEEVAAPLGTAIAAAELRQGVTRLSRRLRGLRSARELSLSKLGVLAELVRDSPTTAGELAASQNQRPQSLTRVFAELARDGLVIRTRSELDQRQVLLEITPAGRDVLRREMAGRDAWLTAALAGLSETEREVLRLAGRLMDQIAEKGPALLLGLLPLSRYMRPRAGKLPLCQVRGLE